VKKQTHPIDESATSIVEEIRGPRLRESKFEPLVGQIATHLQDEIMMGRYRPGERVREQEIADQLNVSRGPVREALRVLEHRGLVEIVPWRGARVVELSAHELNEVYQVRAALFAMMARQAALHVTEKEIAEIGRAIDELDKVARRNVSVREFLTKRYAIADLLTLASRNRLARQLQRTLVQRTQGYYTATSTASQELRFESVALWRQMHEALTQRHASAAEEIARRLADTARTTALAAHGQRAEELSAPRPRSGKPASARRNDRRKPNT